MFISRHVLATLGADSGTVNKNSNDRMKLLVVQGFWSSGDHVSLHPIASVQAFETL